MGSCAHAVQLAINTGSTLSFVAALLQKSGLRIPCTARSEPLDFSSAHRGSKLRVPNVLDRPVMV